MAVDDARTLSKPRLSRPPRAKQNSKTTPAVPRCSGADRGLHLVQESTKPPPQGQRERFYGAMLGRRRELHIQQQHVVYRVALPKPTSMSDNEYGDGDGGEEYDVFANEDDDPQVDETAQPEVDPADMEVIDAGDAGGAGLRSADDRITTKYMTKYERARILGTRALQIRWATLARFGSAGYQPEGLRCWCLSSTAHSTGTGCGWGALVVSITNSLAWWCCVLCP